VGTVTAMEIPHAYGYKIDMALLINPYGLIYLFYYEDRTRVHTQKMIYNKNMGILWRFF